MYTKNGILNLTLKNLEQLSKGLNGCRRQSLEHLTPSLANSSVGVSTCKIP